MLGQLPNPNLSFLPEKLIWNDSSGDSIWRIIFAIVDLRSKPPVLPR